MEFDENGRIYVVEDPGYPLNVEGKVGRIILLEDTDDSTSDTATVTPTGANQGQVGVGLAVIDIPGAALKVMLPLVDAFTLPPLAGVPVADTL